MLYWRSKNRSEIISIKVPQKFITKAYKPFLYSKKLNWALSLPPVPKTSTVRFEVVKSINQCCSGAWIHCAQIACIRNRDRSKSKQFDVLKVILRCHISFQMWWIQELNHPLVRPNSWTSFWSAYPKAKPPIVQLIKTGGPPSSQLIL